MSSLTDLSDEVLATLMGEGNHAAYEIIYKRYWPVLFRHSRGILKDDEEAKDVVQEIFIMLWKKAPDLVLNTSLSSFLYAAARNRIFDLISRKKVKNNYLASIETFIDQGTITTDHLIREKELSLKIEQEVSALPPKMREVFELSRKNNLSYKEIAERLEVSDHTVKKQISNALKILRVKFGMIFLIFFF